MYLGSEWIREVKKTIPTLACKNMEPIMKSHNTACCFIISISYNIQLKGVFPKLEDKLFSQ